MKPIEQVRPFLYWSDSQVRQALDMNSRPAPKWGAKIGFQFPGFGPTIETSEESAGAPNPDSPRAVQADHLGRLLNDVTVRDTDVNGSAHYCRGTAYAYWGVVRLPDGRPSYAAMFGIEPEASDERTMLALFGPRRNLLGRSTGNDIDPGDVRGWSSSSEIGQRLLLGIGMFDPPELRLRNDEPASLARSAVTILKGQGVLHNGGRRDSGLIATCLVSFLARIYLWEPDVRFDGTDRYDRVGIGAPVWVRAESSLEHLTGKTHIAGVTRPSKTLLAKARTSELMKRLNLRGKHA